MSGKRLTRAEVEEHLRRNALFGLTRVTDTDGGFEITLLEEMPGEALAWRDLARAAFHGVDNVTVRDISLRAFLGCFSRPW